MGSWLDAFFILPQTQRAEVEKV